MSAALHPIPDEALADHMAILGKTGSGKTVVAKTLAEGILDRGERFCAVDPTGAWWGLRLKPDGVTPAYPVVIFGGRHADVPIGKASGDKLAEIIGRGNVPAIIDTSMMTIGERTAFFTAFADALFRENDGPLHLFIDEAHVFAPKGKVRSPQAGMMLAATNELVSGGRSRGFRITMITQRPAKLHNDCLTQVETLVAMRLIAPPDRNAVDDWVGEHGDAKQGADVKRSLAQLARGEGWVWAPELDLLARASFPMIKTFDSSAAPKPGDKPRKPRALQASEIAALRETLEAPAAETAPAKKGKGATPEELEVAYQNGLRAGDAEGFQRGLIEGEKRGVVKGQALALTRARTAIDALKVEQAPAVFGMRAEPVALPRGEAPAPVKPRYAPTPKPAATAPSKPSDADSAIRAILAHGPRPWNDIAILTGYAMSGGGLRMARKRLVEAGHVDDAGDRPRALTEAPHAPPLPSPADVVARWKRKLAGSAGAVLDDLFKAGGSSTIAAVCARTGYVATGGGFRSALKKLRNNGLLTQTRDALELADVLKSRARGRG